MFPFRHVQLFDIFANGVIKAHLFMKHYGKHGEYLSDACGHVNSVVIDLLNAGAVPHQGRVVVTEESMVGRCCHDRKGIRARVPTEVNAILHKVVKGLGEVGELPVLRDFRTR